MCLGIPGRMVCRVEGYGDQLVMVDVLGAQRRVNVGMLAQDEQQRLAPGDWVLIHMGFVVDIVDEAAAARAMSGLEMMGRPRDARQRFRIEVRGVVQGVGFRPFVYVAATDLGLTGWVANSCDGVLIEVEGTPEALAEFQRRLRDQPPPLAAVTSVEARAAEPRGGSGFVIESSQAGPRSRTLSSPDVATCPACLAELADPANRRYRHPFITCTDCGPRFTITTRLPYDRAATTMAGFGMCATCRREYDDPASRRFHAEPISCLDCGPRLEYATAGGEQVSGAAALAAARLALRAGAIVAVKGLGGYHLACNATDEQAVAALRSRKRRGTKPFAIMTADIQTARGLVAMDTAERDLLAGSRRPIVLLARLGQESGAVAGSVAPGSPDLGVMLPYTPLHSLLFGLPGDEPGPQILVMTSGNLGGEPIVTDDAEARRRLAPLADAWLRHDRPIQTPCDDSVIRIVDGAQLTIRRSRGYVPLPIELPFNIDAALAAGADLKSACCLAEGRQAWLSQHIGDLDDLATIQALTAAEQHLERLTGVAPRSLAADAHRGYRSSGWARAQAGARPVTPVRHHHAHIAAVMAEHGLDGSTPVLGVAFDGTGYGDDGAIWGGELLIADYKQYRRAGHLRYVPLAGGDVSVQRPYRMALAHLHAAGIEWDGALPCVAACPAAERKVLRHQLATGLGCVATSSMGRLFDAVASLAGVCQVAGYEAQAAIELEGLARAGESDGCGGAYAFGIADAGQDFVFDAAPVIRGIVADLRAGAGKAAIAARFHVTVAALIGDITARAARISGLDTVVLTGGVFQNIVLLRAARGAVAEAGLTVLVPTRLPPNDGGLALGQLMIAAAG